MPEEKSRRSKGKSKSSSSRKESKTDASATKASENEDDLDLKSWVNKSRELESKRKQEEREKADKMAKLLAEQDDGVDEEDEEEFEKPQNSKYTSKHLAGLKVRHGLNKVLEGNAVVLTLKDTPILQDGEINEADDELENVEIAEQLAREKAYKEGKKATGSIADKFENDISDKPKAILAKYDEEVMEGGIILNDLGEVDEESKSRMEEVRKKLLGLSGTEVSLSTSLTAPASDYYSQEEIALKLNKPKKKKKLRKKEKLDYDALEAEAKSMGLDRAEKVESLDNRGSKVVSKREEENKTEFEARKSAYEKAYDKASEKSQALKELDGFTTLEALRKQNESNEGRYAGLGGFRKASKPGLKDSKKSSDVVGKPEEETSERQEEEPFELVEEDDEELQRTLQRARQLALRRNAASKPAVGVEAVMSQMSMLPKKEEPIESTEEGTLVFSDTGEFCRILQLEDAAAAAEPQGTEAIAPTEEMVPDEPEIEPAPDGGVWTEVKDNKDESMADQEDESEEEDEPLAEQGVGKGLGSVLELLKGRGELAGNGGLEWGGRTMDKKRSKLTEVVDSVTQPGFREINIDRKDEFGRDMTPKEAFRWLSYKFHGKGPGKMKQEKRLKQFKEEVKMKKMAAGDTPLKAMEKMRETQAQLNAPYLVLSGQIKPGQTSDPRSTFGVEKEKIGSLTPMLGDEKVEHFLGLKRKGGSMGPPASKRPKGR